MDINNVKPIDYFKTLNEYEIFRMEVNDMPIVFRINKAKIDFSEFDGLLNSQQRQKSIIVEKINDISLFKESKFKKGFDDYTIELSSKMSTIDIVR